jgi:hypothetical protein
VDVHLLFTIGTYVAGFFDFITAVVVIIVALTLVRKADATSGYVLAGAMGIRFLAACCTRAVGQAAGVDESAQMVSGALQIVRPIFDLALWAAVIFCFVQLVKKVPTQA